MKRRVIKITKDKRAISVMIGYILLISFAIIMSSLIYAWLKTYTPTETLECPDEAAFYIKELKCDLGLDRLNLTLENNGKFNIGGYFIRAANEDDSKLFTLDLSENITDGIYNEVLKLSQGGIKFLGEDNSLKPNEESKTEFELLTDIYLIEIIPIRYQQYETKKRLIICSDSRITQEIHCGPGI